jgi:hypothetical protein
MNLMEVEAGRGNCDCDAVPLTYVYLGGEHAAEDEPDGGGGGLRKLRL